MADKSQDSDGAEKSPMHPELVETLLQVSAGEEESDPLLPAPEDEPALATAPGSQGQDSLAIGHVSLAGPMQPSNGPMQPEKGQGPPGPPDKPAPVTVATSTVLAHLTTAELTSNCSQLLESLLSQVVLCSEQGEHGLGESTTCRSVTCNLGGGAPLEDISLAVATLVSENIRFLKRVRINCAKCKTIICNTSQCPCGARFNLSQTIFRKTFARGMNILGQTNIIAKTRPAPTTRTAVTLHRWASYILLAHGVGYMGLISDATSVQLKISCSCFGIQPAKIDLLSGINNATSRVRQREV